MAGGLSKRDIEMIFRAETDAATRPVKELTSDVKALRGGLTDLIKTSDKTDKSLDDLASTTRGLSKAQDELATNRALLTQLNGQATALDRAEAAADKARVKYEQLKTQIEGAEAPTKRLQTSFDAAGRAVAATGERLDAAKKDFAEVKAQIESIIGPVDNFQDAFRTIAVTQKEIAQGLAIAGSAAGEFKREISLAGDAVQKFNADSAFVQAGRDAGLLQEQINYISQFENRVELLTQAKRELSSQNAAFDQAVTAQGAKVGADRVAQLERAFRDAAESAVRLESTNAFRAIAQDSLAALSNTQRLDDTIESTAGQATRLADAILGIINPTQVAAQSLSGALTQIDRANATLAKGKLRPAEFAEVANELSAAQSTLLRIAQDADKFTAQQASLDAATAAYDRQAVKVRELATALSVVDEPTEEMARALKQAETELTGLGTTVQRETGKLGQFSENLKRVGIDSRNVGAGIAQIEAGAKKAAPGIQQVANILRPGGKGGFLGLNPYELQNLGYQVNDIFTSLGSGAPPLQVLAQQAGQILQIFPGIFTSIAANLPIVLLLGGAFAALAGSISEAKSQLETLRQGEVLIARLGNAGDLTAQSFVDLTKTFQDFGVSADDARAAATTFIEQGLNPKAYQDFAVTAKNMSDALGIELPAAAEEVTKAFTSNAQAVLDLDDKYHFLSDTQRDQLVASKDTVTETDEVNKAFTALFNKMQAGADKQRTEWSDAADTLRGAFRNLLVSLSNTGTVDNMTAAFARLAKGVAFAINILAEFNNKQSTNNSAWMPGAPATAKTWKDAIFGKPENEKDNRSFDQIIEDARKKTQAQYDAATRASQAPQTSAGVDFGAGSRGRQLQDEKKFAKDRKDAAKAAKKAASEAEAERKRQAAAAAALAKQYENEQDQLTASLSRFTQAALKGMSAPLEQQLGFAKEAVDEQFKALEDRLVEFRAKFGADAKINGISQGDYALQLQAQKEAIVLQKQLGVYESNVNDIVKERESRLKEINDQQQAGLIDAATALDQAREVTSDINPKLQSAIGLAAQFVKTLTPSAETNALLAKLDRLGGQTGAGGDSTILRVEATEALGKEEAKLNQIIAQRNSLIAATNTLYELGLIGQKEAQDRTAAAYNDTNALLVQQTASMRAFLEANRALFDPVVFDALIAKLQAVDAEAKYVSADLLAVQNAAQQAFTGGFVDMFNVLAEGIANVITGTGSLKDILGDLGRAALSFAAGFLKAIADVMIQLVALRIAKQLLGGGFGGFMFHGGGTVGDYSRGQMRTTRRVSPTSVAAIPKYHSGTAGVGLKSNEQMAILEKGEKVTTEEQQRLEANRIKAMQGGGGKGVRQVLAFGDSEIAGAMAGPAGEKTVVTHILRNKTLIKQELNN